MNHSHIHVSVLDVKTSLFRDVYPTKTMIHLIKDTTILSKKLYKTSNEFTISFTSTSSQIINNKANRKKANF